MKTTMDQNTTMLEIHSALNCNNVDDVAETMSRWHPAILGQMLIAVDKAYNKRVNAPHRDYTGALAKIYSLHKIG